MYVRMCIYVYEYISLRVYNYVFCGNMKPRERETERQRERRRDKEREIGRREGGERYIALRKRFV